LGYVAVIAHGLGSSTVSGELQVAKQGVKMLMERNVEFVVVSFSRPADKELAEKARWVSPLRISRLDKYQRVLTVLKARGLKPRVFLNYSGFPDSLSEVAPHVMYGGVFAFLTPSKYTRSRLWRLYYYPYKALVMRHLDELKKAKLILNSNYSAKALRSLIDVDPKVIYPPIVDFDLYSRSFNLGPREPSVLTIARFERGKSLERSIEIARMTGLRLYLVGSLTDRRYFEELRERSKGLDVVFLPNAKTANIAELLARVAVYFHPTEGEHFGMPIAEAMVAGVVPVVPRESGGYELVPEFGYSTLEEAAEHVRQALGVSLDFRRELRMRVEGLRPENYRARLFEEISEYL